MKKIIIVGAGPSGIIAAKTAKKLGLEPIIFEAKDEIGGVWSLKNNMIWNSLRTNLSKYSCMFSDFPWPSEIEEFPTGIAVNQYLHDFCQFHDLSDCIRLNSKVLKLEFKEEKWLVSVECHSKVTLMASDYAIITSGFFNKPFIPEIYDRVGNEIIHSSSYKAPIGFEQQKVCVVGGSFSAYEIASELTQVIAQVTHLTTREVHILPRYIKAKQIDKSIPIDIFMYSRKKASKKLSEFEQHENTREFLLSIAPDPGAISKDLQIRRGSGDPPFVVISDDYLDHVSTGKIKVSRCTKDEMASKLQLERYDKVIFCTGYRPELNYLDREVLKLLNYDKNDALQPFILAYAAIPPVLKNLGFVGMYRGPYFAIMELQAQLAVSKMCDPSRLHFDVESRLSEELSIREKRPRPQFPHGNYTEFGDSLANELGVYPNVSNNLKDVVMNGPYLPSHFGLNNELTDKKAAEKVIWEVEASYPWKERALYV